MAELCWCRPIQNLARLGFSMRSVAAPGDQLWAYAAIINCKMVAASRTCIVTPSAIYKLTWRASTIPSRFPSFGSNALRASENCVLVNSARSPSILSKLPINSTNIKAIAKDHRNSRITLAIATHPSNKQVSQYTNFTYSRCGGHRSHSHHHCSRRNIFLEEPVSLREVGFHQ